jgi:hypothetical protein
MKEGEQDKKRARKGIKEGELLAWDWKESIGCMHGE